MGAFHEPQRAAGILPAEDAWVCRRDVGSTLPGGTYFAKVHGPNACAKKKWRLPMNLSSESGRGLPHSKTWRNIGSVHGKPPFVLRTHWDHEPSQSTCRPATWCRRLVGRAELFLLARCRQHVEVHGEPPFVLRTHWDHEPRLVAADVSRL